MADEDYNYFTNNEFEDLLEEKDDLLTENKRLVQERDHLRELLRDAEDYIRHPDYEWEIPFAREVDRVLGKG